MTTSKAIAIIIISLMVAIPLVIFFNSGDSDSSGLVSDSPVVSSDPRPVDQINFVEAAHRFSNKANDDRDNDLAVSSDIVARRAALCSGTDKGEIIGWIAKVISISTSFGDIDINLGLEQGVSLEGGIKNQEKYKPFLASLHPGDSVLISGSFDPSANSCLSTTAFTDIGSMVDPNFMITLTSISAFNSN